MGGLPLGLLSPWEPSLWDMASMEPKGLSVVERGQVDGEAGEG